ncbi:MAG: beta-lactamase family protein [bacterium]|nr:beta-lactamase family protein [bacterium]
MKILRNYSSKNDINICQIIAYKDGKKVIEAYKNGFSRDDTMNVMSVTKSVTSLLIGIAIDLGLINSVDDFVMDYFKDYTPKRGEKTIYEVKIKHLLTMTAPYKGKSEPWKKICTSDDWMLAALDILGGPKGITNEFRYHTLGIQILMGIIEKQSKMNGLDFANKYLFTPLGIEKRVSAECYTKEDQFNYVMNKANHGNVWFLDPKNSPTAGWGLSLSALDLAKIGLMVLNKGMYNNKRIVSEKWIDEISIPRISLGEEMGNQDYGYLWWFPHRKPNVIAAQGDGGNIIYINKDLHIVVAITSYLKPLVFDRVKFIEENIVKAINSKI